MIFSDLEVLRILSVMSDVAVSDHWVKCVYIEQKLFNLSNCDNYLL